MDDIDDRYENAKIYKLESNVNDLFYLGSTVNSLARRLRGHKDAYRAYQKGTRGYCSSFDVLATGDYCISLYKDYPCHNKMQLDMEEGYEIEHNLQYTGCVNECIAGMSARFGGMKQYKKELWKNTEIIECECGGKYHGTNFRQRHFHSKIHQYWEEHGQPRPKKDDLFRCECGVKHMFKNRARHFESLKHQKYLASKE